MEREEREEGRALTGFDEQVGTGGGQIEPPPAQIDTGELGVGRRRGADGCVGVRVGGRRCAGGVEVGGAAPVLSDD